MKLTFREAVEHVRYPFTHTHPDTKAKTYTFDCRLYVIAPALILAAVCGYKINLRFGLGIGLSVFYGLALKFKELRSAIESSAHSHPEIHDSEKWLRNFNSCVDKNRTYPVQFQTTPCEMLGSLLDATKRATKNGYHINEVNRNVAPNPAKIIQIQTKTVYHKNVSQINTLLMNRNVTPIHCHAVDALNLTKNLANQGFKPVYLSMVDLHEEPYQTKERELPSYQDEVKVNPQVTYTGHYEQERRGHLWIRSFFHKIVDASQNLNLRKIGGCFQHSFSSMSATDTLYTPGLGVIRNEGITGYKFCEPYFVDVISSCTSQVDKTGKVPDKNEFKIRLNAMLRTAFHTNHDCIVLDEEALTCSGEIGPLIKEVLRHPEFTSRFKRIDFVTSAGQLQDFKDLFEEKSKFLKVLTRIFG